VAGERDERREQRARRLATLLLAERAERLRAETVTPLRVRIDEAGEVLDAQGIVRLLPPVGVRLHARTQLRQRP